MPGVAPKFGMIAVFAIAIPLLAQTFENGTDQTSGTAKTAKDQSDKDRNGNQGLNPFQDPRDRIYYPGDTERFKPLMYKLGGNILLDQKEIWTSPFHYTLIPLTAGFYGYGVLRDDPKPREVGVLGAEALLDSVIVVGILKPIAGRNRPDSSTEKAHFFDGGTSFPSGHAIESWSLASLIAHEYGRGSKIVPIVSYGLAGIVSTARFAAQRHFASDIVAGGAMGWFIGRYVYRTHMDHAIHKHGWVRPRIIPEAEPGSRTYGVVLAFGN